MWFRRALFIAMFPAAVVLPLWVLVTRGLLASTLTTEFLFYLVGCPILFVVLAATAGFIRARKSVRFHRAVGWRDAVVLAATWLALLVSGFYAVPVLAVIDVVLVVGAFWLAVWELVDETRKRVRRFVGTLDGGIRQPGFVPPGNGRTIVIEPRK